MMGHGKSMGSISERTARHIGFACKRLQRNMNNRRIRSKTIYLYVFCVLVPVLVTNIFIIGNTLKASRNEVRKNINNIADSVARYIASSIESAVYITEDCYASNAISNFLEKHYADGAEYFSEYNRVLDNYVFYTSSKRLISGITLYSDNPTMINGGKYFRIDAVKSEEWYLEFKQSDSDLLVYPYYNKTTYDNFKQRMLSVVRKLDYQEKNKIEKIVKLDLNYNMIAEYIKSAAFNAAVYVCHGDKILFSSDKSGINIKEEYIAGSMLPADEMQLHKALTSYGFDFDIYLKGYKSNYASLFKDNLWLIAVLFLADALIPAIVLTLFSGSITKRILVLGEHLKRTNGEEFDLISDTKGRDEIGELLDNYNLMAARMKDLIEYEYKSRLERQELHLARQQAELLALHSQVNPHFMFNMLESIRMRSVIKGEHETSRMIEGLAGLMRKSAEWGADLITLEQEIGFVRDYLELQKYRFGDAFNYRFRISESCRSYMIPSLVLVTFAENSCVHGLNREGHSGTIFISAYEENSCLYIDIEDTGVGMEEEQVLGLEKSLNEADIDELQKSASLGMLNACIRLKKYCGRQTKLIIESEKQAGTCIVIKIPVANMKKNIESKSNA